MVTTSGHRLIAALLGGCLGIAIGTAAAESPAPKADRPASGGQALMEQLGLIPHPVPSSVVLASGAIVAEQAFSGTIVSSQLQQLLIGPGDRVFLKPNTGTDVKDGDVFLVARAMRKVRHPKTRERLGTLIRVLGEVRVREHQRGLILGEVTRAFEPLEAGDSLLLPSAATVVPQRGEAAGAPKSLTGFIVESKEGKDEHGQLDVVYLDKGRRDGVRVDDLYAVIRQGRDAGFFRSATPDTNMGELRIIAVQEATATAEITKSVEPINIGDGIEGPVVSAGLPAP